MSSGRWSRIAAASHEGQLFLHPCVDQSSGKHPDRCQRRLIRGMFQVSLAPASFRRGSFKVETRRLGYDGRQAGPGSYAPFSHWCTCPKVSLGPSRLSFIGEVSPEALPQARIRSCCPLGPVPPAPEPRSGTIRKPAAGRLGRWVRIVCVHRPSKPLKVFQARPTPESDS